MPSEFSGLDKFGLGDLNNINIFEKKEEVIQEKAKEEVVKEIREEDFLFDKTYTCPCCNLKFKTKAVRVGRNKLERLDTDLRPIYAYVDAIKYDAVVCENCGYAGVSINFEKIGDRSIRLIKEKISSKFHNAGIDKPTYSYDDAIERMKLALLSTVIKGARSGEKAYICLKLAWLIRGKKDNSKNDISRLEEEEMNYLKNAYDGFSDAYMNENFPICGMDVNTLSIILAETARKLGNTSMAMKYIEPIIISKNVTERMKDLARNIRDRCKEKLD